MRRLDRSDDRLAPKLRDLQREQDGSEIKSRELELITDRASNLGQRRDTIEKLRDTAAIQDTFPQERGGRCRSSAARAA